MQSSAPSSRVHGNGGGDWRVTADGGCGFGPSGSRRRRRKRQTTWHVMPLLAVLVLTLFATTQILPPHYRLANPAFTSAFFVPMLPATTRDHRGRTTGTWSDLASVRVDGRWWGRRPMASPSSSRRTHPRSTPVRRRPLVIRWLSAPSGAGAATTTTDKCGNVTVNSSFAHDGAPVLMEVDVGKKNGVASPTLKVNTLPANGGTAPTSRGSKSEEETTGTDNCTVVAAAVKSGNSTSEAAATNSTGAVAAISSSTTTTRIRTANGGYLHTMESRTRISIANKGKIPWNKGRTRTPEERARISAGVRERNRLRLEAECRANGTTIEEFLAKKEEQERRRKKDRAARRTARGGYTPTDETRAKISAVLREKWASGDVKTLKRKKMVAATKDSLVASATDFNLTDAGGNITAVVGKERAPASASAPRGPHSEETKEKIRVALKAKWSEDAEYRRAMTAKAHAHSNSTDVRRRISETLKARWRDPEFRATMMNKIANRKSQVGRVTDEAHRRKISETMRAKWRDPGYRRKALDGMAKKRSEMGITSSSTSSGAVRSRSRSARKLDAAARGDGVGGLVRPVRPKAVRKKRALKAKAETEACPNGVSTPTTKRTRTTPTKKRKLTTSPKKAVVAKRRAEPSPSPKPSSATTPAPTEEELRVERMREERKDLYDLLYGNENEDEVLDKQLRAYSSSILDEDEEDFDVDNYDPYGLDRLEQSRSV